MALDVKGAVLNDLTAVKKYLLLLLNENNSSPINGKLWYQKELFLLTKNDSSLSDETNFEPYFWGPHSELADSEMDELIQLGLVKNIGHSFALTDLGKAISSEINHKVSKSQRALVYDIKEFLNDLSKEELLLFIYITYPEMCEDAVELKNLILRRKIIALGMYKKGKISIGKTAELSGISIDQLSKELGKKGQ